MTRSELCGYWTKFFREPGHIGPLKKATATGRSGGGCGDLVRLDLLIGEGRVREAAFLATGCPGAIAGAAACADLLGGMTLLEAASVTSKDIVARLVDLPVKHEGCAALGADALSAALESYAGRDDARLGQDLIAVAMSGGVDSSTVAMTLADEGRDVVGITQRLHDFGGLSASSCCTPQDIDDARAVAGLGGFAHIVVDMRTEFGAGVIDNFCNSYIAGRTPNPCVECNRVIRFTLLLKKVEKLGASVLATGHYARIQNNSDSGLFEVRRARDRRKDQSYMFWSAPQTALRRLTTPLGELTKDEVRMIAGSYGLPVADKADSQDVCFVPDSDYAGFVRRETGFNPRPGLIKDREGKTLGKHDGLLNYTIGQRRGLDISAPAPLYVLALNVDDNELVVGQRTELDLAGLRVGSLNLIGFNAGRGPFEADVMLRYNGDLRKARVEPCSPTEAVIEFSSPFGPVAPGQSAVFYDGEALLGGGIIL